MNGQVAWMVPSNIAAEKECQALTISQILDRAEELEKIIGNVSADEAQVSRARIMLKACHRTLHSATYRKV